MTSAALLAVVVAAAPASRPLTLYFTGDTGGEVAPCGCKANPTGGLAKRKTVLAKAPKSSLIVDAGNALFAGAGASDEAKMQRAAFVLRTMASLGTTRMAVGHKDLSAGVTFLEAQAAANGVALLSANAKLNGQPHFQRSLVVTVDGLKVALIGVLPEGPVPGVPELVGTAPVEAVKAAVAQLGPRDLTVVLATTSYVDSLAIAEATKGTVDLVIQSGEYRGATEPQNVGGLFVLSTGQKGQVVGKVDLQLGGHGPLVDRGESDRTKEQLVFLDHQLDALRQRRALAKDAQAKAELDGTLKDMQARRSSLATIASGPTKPGARSMKLEWITLGSNIIDDAELKRDVLTIEPTYAGH